MSSVDYDHARGLKASRCVLMKRRTSNLREFGRVNTGGKGRVEIIEEHLGFDEDFMIVEAVVRGANIGSMGGWL